ncbi:argininosuccinate synthase domain-containing protein [Massilia cavernae]|uniref:argininosuccinate synthase domain-containing protein n=1 Tax=Massilia cavernae TaxID=2320864 RepID=UPI0016044F95|nr:argininosuccinate synthase domain-containing protein [Massilia cavernae]
MKFAELQGKKIGICASGGLVSLFITQRLKEEGVGYEQFIVDIGQPGEEAHAYCSDNIDLMQGTRVIDLKEDIAQVFLQAVRAQAQYDGGYWNTTGIARAVTVKGLVAALRSQQCNVLAHGAVHGGNDEFRFTYYLKMFAPEIIPFSPWEDPTTSDRFRTRAAMGDFVADADQALMRSKAHHSVDANLGGVSHESREVELLSNSTNSIAPIMGVRVADAPDQPERCTIVFKNGLPVEINGQAVSAYQAIAMANQIAGRNGVVLKNVLENRMNGTKGRGLYESPGLDLLGTAARHLFQATVDKDGWELMRFLSPFIARQTYAGRLYDPATQIALASAEELTENASGVVEMLAFKGTYLVDRVRDYSKSRFTAQQFRFAHGGQKWITEAVA